MDGMLSTNLAARYVETPLLGNASLVISLEPEWESLRADQSSNSNGYVLRLPPANEVSNGQTILFNNTGANSFIVQDNAGVQVFGSVIQREIARLLQSVSE